MLWISGFGYIFYLTTIVESIPRENQEQWINLMQLYSVIKSTIHISLKRAQI